MATLKCQTGKKTTRSKGYVCTKCRKPILGFHADGCWCDLDDEERSAPVWITTEIAWKPRKEKE